MKHLAVLFLFSYLSFTNCGGGPSQDLSGLLLLLAGGGGANSFHCGQTVANPVTFASTNGATVDEANLVTALGGNNCQTPSLTDNGNGTVTDSANNFIWTLCVIDGTTDQPHTYNNPNCGAFGGTDASYDQPAASNVCAGLTFAGRSNWKLPDAIQSNLLRSDSSPYALGAFGSANNSISDAGTVWTSTVISSSLGIVSLYQATNSYQSFATNSTSQAVVVCLAEF